MPESLVSFNVVVLCFAHCLGERPYATAIIASMPDETPDTVVNPESEAKTEADSPPPSRRAPVQVKAPQPRWLAPAALLVAVVAVGLAVWALVSPPTKASTSAAGSETNGGDPKTRVCAAFNTVSTAVQVQTHNDLGPDPVAQAAVAGNARLALFGGGVYLEKSLGSDTPSNLADPVRRFAVGLQNIGIDALAGATNTDPAQAAQLSDADADRKQVVELCK